MSPRKSSQIADSPSLPTIKDYFDMMAEGQKNDIRRLKQAAAGKNSEQPNRRPADGAVPDPWLLHPIRRSKVAAKPRGKSAARSAAKEVPEKATKKAVKKASKKTSKRARR
jgi:hypothetical protein